MKSIKKVTRGAPGELRVVIPHSLLKKLDLSLGDYVLIELEEKPFKKPALKVTKLNA